jgi:hypothetical protein
MFKYGCCGWTISTMMVEVVGMTNRDCLIGHCV